jgi:large subunit ribosomal protein L10
LALTKERKSEILRDYIEVLGKAQGMVVAEYRGMTMKKFNETRKLIREAKGAFTVTKNTIFLIALREVGMAAPEELFNGPVAVGIAFNDLPSIAKALLQRAKEDELLKLRGAVMGQSVFTEKQMEMVSTMPTLKEAQAGLIGTIIAPVSSILSLLNQPGTNLAAVLQAYADKDNNSGTQAA